MTDDARRPKPEVDERPDDAATAAPGRGRWLGDSIGGSRRAPDGELAPEAGPQAEPAADDDCAAAPEPAADEDLAAAPEPAVTADLPAGPASDPEPEQEPEPASDPEPQLEADPGPQLEAGPEARPAASADLEPGGRPLPLRLARLHLRMGSLALARAELESFASGGSLDAPALLDLAEARWRTGDLAGAGEAANAAIGRGVDDPLALLIAAEAVAGLGRPAEARRLAGRVLEATGGTLDVLFAGMPRSLIWPGEPEPELDEAPADAGAVGAAVVVRGRQPEAPVPASAAAAEAFAGGRGSLARGDVPTAALRLGVAIRLEPGFAEAVLAAIGDRASSAPVLALVAGDALRLLGREQEALAAFDTARGKPQARGAPVSVEPETLWPDD